MIHDIHDNLIDNIELLFKEHKIKLASHKQKLYQILNQKLLILNLLLRKDQHYILIGTNFCLQLAKGIL